MPRIAKEKNEELNNTTTTKGSKSTKKVATTKISKETTKKTKSASKSTAKKTTTKKASSKAATKKADAKTTASTQKPKVTTTKSRSTAKKQTKSNSKTVTLNPVIASEFYELPFRYNQTVVKILAQTPTTLFIYWDISDEDRNSYIQKYGENFFEVTKPYLLITNKTMNYSFETEINDFANSWYLHINDASCEYKIDLIRKFTANSHHTDEAKNLAPYYENERLYITYSNEIETPNNHILFDKLNHNVFFRNIKTNITEEKNISSLSFLQKIGKVYNIYDLYQELYQNELSMDEDGLNLPTSSSSTFK